jgi:transposase
MKLWASRHSRTQLLFSSVVGREGRLTIGAICPCRSLVSGVCAFTIGDVFIFESGDDPVKEPSKLITPAPTTAVPNFRQFLRETEKKIISRPTKHSNSAHSPAPAGLPQHLRHINVNAAGIDIGAHEHWVAVPEGRDSVSLRRFATFTADLHALADWLSHCGITSVAMESTGVYWIPLFEILEERGFEVSLVDARRLKNVPGRKSDVLDCQWIQELHTYGLLAAAFRPSEEVCVLRSYLRQKEMLVQSAAMHIQHMQKALQQMNLVLHQVVSDITGLTGMKILKAILAGERDPQVLAALRDRRCQNSSETIAKSLVGNYRQEHLFALGQAVELYEIYRAKIADCEAAIVAYLKEQGHKTDDEPPPPQKRTPARERVLAGEDMRDKLYKMSGVDLFAISGLATETILTLAGEVGFDMRPWKSVKHFASWLALCPGTKKSGGRVLSAKTKRNANRAAQAFRMAASTQARAKTSLGAFYRRIRGRSGGREAVTATAHKIARLYYSLLKNGTAYVEVGEAAYEEKYKERRIRYLHQQAVALGYQLLPVSGT